MQHEETCWQKIPHPEEGQAVSFDVMLSTSPQTSEVAMPSVEMREGGFAICVGGSFYAYRNHCPHTGSPLDWMPNQFFSEDRQMLMCHTHGALFDPSTGRCLSGPCPRGLYPLPLQILDDGLLVPCRV